MVLAFALGVGEGVTLSPPARNVLLFDVLTVVVFASFFPPSNLRAFALGVGVGVGLCCLYMFDLLLLRLMEFGFGVGVGCGPALAAPMLPTRAIAVMANAFGNVFLMLILPTTKSIVVRALLFLLFFGRIFRSVLIPSSLNEFRFAKFVEPRG
jgi:hypothetical protein